MRRTLTSVGHDIAAVAPAYVSARLLILLGWLVAGAVGESVLIGGAPRVHSEGLLAWDGTWYEAIAAHGYQALPDEALRFFPLYPMLARALSVLIGGSVPVALVVVSNAAAMVAAVLALRLARLEGVGEEAARRVAALVSLFPAGFVLVWAYSEALFLVAALGVFLAVRQGHWWVAAAFGLMAGATRPLGLLLVAPVLIEAVGAWRSSGRSPLLAMASAAAAPIAGTGAYLGWVAWRYGDALLPATVQGDFRGDAVDPFSRLFIGAGDLFGPERWGDGLHVPFAIVFAVLAVWSFRIWPPSYGVFAVAVLVFALGAENLNSLQRYALNAFPLAMTLAVVARTERTERLVLAVCGAGIMALSALAWLGLYVP